MTETDPRFPGDDELPPIKGYEEWCLAVGDAVTRNFEEYSNYLLAVANDERTRYLQLLLAADITAESRDIAVSALEDNNARMELMNQQVTQQRLAIGEYKARVNTLKEALKAVVEEI